MMGCKYADSPSLSPLFPIVVCKKCEVSCSITRNFFISYFGEKKKRIKYEKTKNNKKTKKKLIILEEKPEIVIDEFAPSHCRRHDQR